MTLKPKWTTADMPDLTGRIAIVTGASSGVGYEIALGLAAHGARVVLAGRDRSRTELAEKKIRDSFPAASVEVRDLDLAELSSVKRFARDFLERHDGLDILVNNAGISGGPFRKTRDGLEIQFQVNYLAHFALTALLMPALLGKTGARVVNQSSDVAASGEIDFADLQSEKKYGLVRTYSQAKLANLVFSFELNRRFHQAGFRAMSLAANPGVAKSNIVRGREAEWGRGRVFSETLLWVAQSILALPAAKGALPALYQATDPDADGAQYVVGVKWPQAGFPVVSKVPASARDPAVALKLWEVSEQLSGVRCQFARGETHGL